MIFDQDDTNSRRLDVSVHAKHKGSAFGANILSEELPGHFLPVTFEYAGKLDLGDHVCMLHQFSDGIKCQVFVTTLTCPARQWFALLQCNSIHNAIPGVFYFQCNSYLFLIKCLNGRVRVVHSDHRAPFSVHNGS